MLIRVIRLGYTSSSGGVFPYRDVATALHAQQINPDNSGYRYREGFDERYPKVKKRFIS
jgi:hypothetical protein